MKGLILAGGKGTRLRPLTHSNAKQLVPVANKPILFYGIEHLAEVGITDVGIIVGETGAEIRAAVGDGSRWGVRITYIEQDQPRGLAHAVLVARPFLGDDDFVMYLGDNMLGEGLTGLMARYEADPEPRASAFILLSEVADPQRFGVAEVEGGRVVRLVEKPTEPRSNLAMAGVYLLTSRIHDAIGSIQPSARGELEIVDAIQWLIDHDDRVRHEPVSGWWLDTGKKDSLLEANRRVLDSIEEKMAGDVDAASTIEGRVLLEPGAAIVRSTVRGPVAIGADAVITDSDIGPFSSIGARAHVTASTIENSVLLEEVSLVGVQGLVDSLIGRNCEITRADQGQTATRLLIGDHCAVDLP